MKVLADRLKNRKGSLTVEAAITLPVFVCVILSIALFMRVVYVHQLIQHAITDTANELATYSYLYSATGVQARHDAAKEYMEDKSKVFENHAKDVFSAYSSLKANKEQVEEAVGSNSTAIINGDIDSLDVESLKSDLGSAIGSAVSDAGKISGVLADAAKDPKKEIISIMCILADGAFEEAKTALATPLIKFCMAKHLRTEAIQDENKRLRGLQVEGGFEGLDFTESSLFKDKKTIDIVVRYKVKTILPIKLIPDVYIIQRATVRAWLDGDGKYPGRGSSSGSPSSPQTSNLWNLPPLERGKQIQQLEGRNLPPNFPGITKHDGNGNVVKVVSIDLEDATYLKPRGFASKVRTQTKELAEFKNDTYQGVTINAKAKTLLIVVPEGTLTPEHEKAIREIEAEYSRDGHSIRIEVKEAYGKKSINKE